MGDRQPEIVNTQGFTPQAIEQVNQVAALIDKGNNEDNATADEIEKEMIRNDFIAFSSLLARNANNPNFTQFANDVGFSRLFKAYRERNEDEYLMNFFIQVANSNNLTNSSIFSRCEEVSTSDSTLLQQELTKNIFSEHITRSRICSLRKKR